MPMTTVLCSLQDQSHPPLKNDLKLLLQKTWRQGQLITVIATTPDENRENQHQFANNRNSDHDQNDVSFQFQGKIAKVISTGLESIFCFVYCDVSR